MSKLSIDHKTILWLFSEKKSDFMIPDYQRPYAWTETQCQTLWDDLFEFAFPEENKDKFDSNEEYYLWPIVTFLNEDKKLEVIDWQQRLTTLMLLLRAFFDSFQKAKDQQTIDTRKIIEKCIWKTDEFENPLYDELKIDSEVATDADKDEFLSILKTWDVSNKNSQYAVNFKFFKEKIKQFQEEYPMFVAYFPIRILKNCILLPIEADNQNTALRIFSTLNDRWLPLSDADIFKAQLYNYYKSWLVEWKDKNDFIDKWKELEEACGEIWIPMDELFARYMYYERSKLRIKLSTTEALRKFYERDKYTLLKNDKILDNLTSLINFRKDIENQNKDRFTEEVLCELFILNYAPNGMRIYILSVYFMQYKDENDRLDNEKLLIFLKKIIWFIFAYAITNPWVNALRTPLYSEMINIIDEKEVTFDAFRFHVESLKTSLNNFEFLNQRPITKSILTWWAFSDKNQPLINKNDKKNIFEIEHIFAKNRNLQWTLVDKRNIESIWNKILLEKRININASDFRFEDKKKYYEWYTNSKWQSKEWTNIVELKYLIKKSDFSEHDIEERKVKIINTFLDYLKDNNLLEL